MYFNILLRQPPSLIRPWWQIFVLFLMKYLGKMFSIIHNLLLLHDLYREHVDICVWIIEVVNDKCSEILWNSHFKPSYANFIRLIRWLCCSFMKLNYHVLCLHFILHIVQPIIKVSLYANGYCHECRCFDMCILLKFEFS